MSKEQWNERYSVSEYVYGKEPNEFFREQLGLLTPGCILMPAEGEGRNAVYAALKGWTVEAFDQSEEGRAKALQLAAEIGVTIRYEIGDLGEMQYPADYFDAAGLIFVHQDGKNRRAFQRRLNQLLKPGATVIFEAYSVDQLNYGTGGPKDINFLVRQEDIAEDFNYLDIILIDTQLVEHREGLLHVGTGSVVRMVGRKPH